MKELSNAEKLEILKMQEFGVYRQSEGAIIAYNDLTGCQEPVKSFSLENIPVFDAILVFGGYPRIVKNAKAVLEGYYSKYFELPEFMTVGRKPNKGQKNAGAEAEIYEMLMINIGFDKKWVMKNHLVCKSEDTVGNIIEIRRIVQSSPTLGRLQRPRIAVVTEPGYLLRTAQELPFFVSEYEFLFFEASVTPLNEKTFCVESFDDGYGVDVTLASVLNSMRGWNKERLPLPDSKMNLAPSFDSIRKYVEYGFAFYMYPEMMNDLGITDEAKIRQLRNNRKIEVTGYSLDGIKYGNGLPSCQPAYIMQGLQKMIAQINAEK